MNRMASMLALVACTGVAFAATAQAAESKVTVVNVGAGTDSMKVVRDKDTGKIRAANDEEIAAMGPNRLGPSIVTQSRPSTTVVERADGSATIRRSLEDLDSIVLERGADGRPKMRHGGKDAPKASPQNAAKE